MIPRIAVICLVVSVFAGAQMADLSLHNVPVDLASGPRTNPTSFPTIVWTETLAFPGTTCVQVHLADLALQDEDDALVVTSLGDSDQQVLRLSNVKFWENHSAWFNGPGVTLELRLAPGSSGSVTVDSAWVSAPTIAQPDTICQTDDRTPFGSGVICRLVASAAQTGGGCTGFLVTNTSMILSAGSCVGTQFTVAEFNCPFSTTGGLIVHPAVAEQFPVDSSTILSANGAAGANWAVARLHPNSTGGTAAGAHGFLTVATSYPTLANVACSVRGYGADASPDPTRNFVLQSDTATLASVSGHVLHHTCDTNTGSEGSPILVNNEVVGINTHGGCNPTPISLSNAGTGVLESSLQVARTATSGCATVTPPDGNPVNAPCSNTILTIVPVASQWNVVGVNGPGDWDVAVSGVSSTRPGGSADFVFADGRAGTIPPASGNVFNSFSGSNAPVQFRSESNIINAGAAAQFNWNALDVFRAFAINVTSAGGHDVFIHGDPQLTYSLYTAAGTTAWRSRSALTPTAAGTAGDGGQVGVNLPVGVHLLVIARTGGVGTVPQTLYTVNVCPSVAAVTVPVNGVASSTAACNRLGVTPVSVQWNVVMLGSLSDWNLGVGAAQSNSLAASTECVVANGTLGAVTPNVGSAWRVGGSLGATFEHRTPAAIAVGSVATTTIPAGSIGRAFAFTITTPGQHGIMFPVAPSSFAWQLFDAGTSPAWRAKSAAVASGTVSATPATVTLTAGQYLLVAHAEPGPVAASTLMRVLVAPTVATLTLVQGTTNSANGAATPFIHTPQPNVWNVVAATSDATTGDDLTIGAVDSAGSGNGVAEMLVADGHAGVIDATPGIVTRTTGAASISIEHAVRTLLPFNSVLNDSMGTADVVRLYEFNAPVAASYQIVVSGAPSLRFRLYAPSGSSAWVPKLSSIANGLANGGTTLVSLAPGAHALVVHRDGATGTAASYSLTVTPAPSGQPAITGLSPATVTAGAAQFTLTVNGTGITPFSFARFDGVSLPSSSPAAGTVEAIVPAQLVTTGGVHTITLVNGPPGGGTSSGMTFTVNNPAPTLASVAAAVPLGTSGTVTVDGSGFVAGGSIVRWGTTDLATTFVSSTQLTAALPAAVNVVVGPVAVRVVNGAPGGGASGAINVQSPFPTPSLTSLSPSTLLVGSSSATITVFGTGFFAGASTGNVNGLPVATTVSSQTAMDITIPAASLTTPGSRSIVVTTTGPGGGASNTLQLLVNYPLPTVTGISPSSALVGSGPAVVTVTGTGFVANQSLVTVDGTPITTTVQSATQAQATLSSAVLNTAHSVQLRMQNPPPGGGASNAMAFTIQNPTPVITGLSQTSFAFGAASAPLAITCTGLVPGATATWNNTPIGVFESSPGVLTGTVPTTLLAIPGPVSIVVQNPAPNTGPSAPVAASVDGPRLTAISPSVMPILLPGSLPQVVTLTGSNFAPTSQAWADGIALPGAFNSSTSMTVLIGPSIQGALRPGALAIVVQTTIGPVRLQSNARALVMGSGNNQGTFQYVPVDAGPGTPVTFRFEGMLPGAPITVIADLTAPLPLAPFPDASTNMVLSVYASMLPVVDGLGLFGPPAPVTTTFDPAATAPGGVFEIPGLVIPNPPLGVDAALQAVVLDPSSPIGLRLTWARFPLSL